MRVVNPYPTYQDVDAPWIGSAPQHWDITRIKHLLSEVDERSTTGEETLLSMRQLQGLVPHHEVSEKEFAPEDLVGYKKVRAGQLVMNRMRASIGLFASAKQDGLVSPDYAVFDIVPDINVDYLVNLFQTKSMGEKFRVESKGLGTGSSGFLRLYTDRFGPIGIAMPPEDEQTRIVDYITGSSLVFHNLIGTKKRFIDLLLQQKRAIIQRGVTGGFSSARAYKPSGLDYLGDIPTDWITKPLKRCAAINAETLPETTNDDFEFFYIDIGAVATGMLVEDPELIRFANAPSRARRIVRMGDTIISTVRTYLKAVYFIQEDLTNLIVSTGFAVLRPADFVEPEFLSYAIQSNYFVDCVTANSVGVAYPAIAESRLATFKIVLPPTRREQSDIIAEIKREAKQLDEAILRTRKEIELIREYRQKLISDLVMGRLDVRSVPPPALPFGASSNQDLLIDEGIADDESARGNADAED